MKDIILIGAPGAGKGTQSKKLVEGYGYKHVSTGDLIRLEIEMKSLLGNRVKQIVEDGGLVDDGLILDLLKKNLPTVPFILDGIPRTINQAQMLDRDLNRILKAQVIYLKLDPDVVIKRVTSRLVCKNCHGVFNSINNLLKEGSVCSYCGASGLQRRADDTGDVVKERHRIFMEQSKDLLDYYQKGDKSLNRLKTIDASEAENEVFRKIVNLLNLSSN
jgi:adenylate kinase